MTGVILALLLGLWAMPPVRAAVRDFWQIGAVRIWLVEPTPAPTSEPPVSTPDAAMPHRLNLAGVTTLQDAAAQVDFALSLPTYPEGVGLPDAVFMQEFGAPLVVMVWMSHEEPGKALYSLQTLGSDAIVTKVDPPVVQTTTVNGREAAWTEGPYMLSYGAEGTAEWRMDYLVSGRVLIWEAEGLTYRLESNLSMDEAVRMAESLEPWRE